MTNLCILRMLCVDLDYMNAYDSVMNQVEIYFATNEICMKMLFMSVMSQRSYEDMLPYLELLLIKGFHSEKCTYAVHEQISVIYNMLIF